MNKKDNIRFFQLQSLDGNLLFLKEFHLCLHYGHLEGTILFGRVTHLPDRSSIGTPMQMHHLCPSSTMSFVYSRKSNSNLLPWLSRSKKGRTPSVLSNTQQSSMCFNIECMLQHRMQQFTCNAAILRIADKAWHLHPIHIAWGTHQKLLVFPITVDISKQIVVVHISKWIYTHDVMHLHHFTHQYNCT